MISPEGCAAILWRDAGEAKKAAAAFKPDALHCLELGVIDGIVPSREGGAHRTTTRRRACSARRSARRSTSCPRSPGERLRRATARAVPHGSGIYSARARSPLYEPRFLRFSTDAAGFLYPQHPQRFPLIQTARRGRQKPASSADPLV